MSPQAKIGLTGGTGLIGKALRMKLSASVSLVVRDESQVNLRSNEDCIVGSFSDQHVVNKFVAELDVLIHAASGIGPRSEFNTQLVLDDLVGTLDLAKSFFSKTPQGHFIFLSTAGGLYDLEDAGIKTEESVVLAKSLYGAIKLLIEDSLEQIRPAGGMVTVLRPSAVYGDSFKKNQDVGLIDKLLKSTLKESVNLPVPIFDKMESARDYLHVDDLVRALLAVVNRKAGAGYEIYNVGTGTESSIGEVIRVINLLGEEKVRVNFLATMNNRTSLIVNADKLFQHTGWRAEIGFYDGVWKMYSELTG
jgi:nucleoside-diphosphate-sugar epimerase